jgi:hypothetical protein
VWPGGGFGRLRAGDKQPVGSLRAFHQGCRLALEQVAAGCAEVVTACASRILSGPHRSYCVTDFGARSQRAAGTRRTSRELSRQLLRSGTRSSRRPAHPSFQGAKLGVVKKPATKARKGRKSILHRTRVRSRRQHRRPVVFPACGPSRYGRHSSRSQNCSGNDGGGGAQDSQQKSDSRDCWSLLAGKLSGHARVETREAGDGATNDGSCSRNCGSSRDRV